MLNLRVILIFNIVLFSCDLSSKETNIPLQTLSDKRWYSGDKNCSDSKAPAFERFQYDQNTFILRQNKCDHYEAPFVYLLFGEKRALLIDTGATTDKANNALAQAVNSIITERSNTLELPANALIPLLVTHSHSHGDHTAGDEQFTGLTNTTLIQPNSTSALNTAFSFKNWPTTHAVITLGNRNIMVIPTPGHQAQAITFYDDQTSLLLTGDSIYPGRLYIKQWQVYRDSIQRLVNFAETYPISAILGAHIEMSDTFNVDYPVKTTYQPNELSLVLTVDDLYKLNRNLNTLGDEPKRTYMGNMIIYPIE